LIRSTNMAARTLQIIAFVVVLGLVLWALSDLVLLVFAAVLLAVMLRGAAELLARLIRLPNSVALALVVLIVTAAVLGFAWFAGPRFVAEGQQLAKELYSYAGQIQQHYSNSFWGRLLKHAMSSQDGIGIAPLAPKLLTVTFGTFGGAVLLAVTTLYLAISPMPYMRGIVLLVPPAHRPRAEQIMAQLTHTLRYWMVGQLIDMAVVGVLSTLGLTLLGIPLPLALGVLAGVLTFVPYLGAILAAIPAIIIASTTGLTAILWVILLYAGCHFIEGYVVSPLVSRRTVHLPPAVTVLSMALLGELFGFPGVLIATPLTAAIIVLVKELYVRDALGTDPDEEA
jgi:predicted PurR-regulated permease PerM